MPNGVWSTHILRNNLHPFTFLSNSGKSSLTQRTCLEISLSLEMFSEHQLYFFENLDIIRSHRSYGSTQMFAVEYNYYSLLQIVGERASLSLERDYLVILKQNDIEIKQRIWR